MRILTFLGYNGDELKLEADHEFDIAPDYTALANGLRGRMDYTRVVILDDGKFRYDTNDHRH